jgi:hypothetical protein
MNVSLNFSKRSFPHRFRLKEHGSFFDTPSPNLTSVLAITAARQRHSTGVGRQQLKPL